MDGTAAWADDAPNNIHHLLSRSCFFWIYKYMLYNNIITISYIINYYHCTSLLLLPLLPMLFLPLLLAPAPPALYCPAPSESAVPPSFCACLYSLSAPQSIPLICAFPLSAYAPTLCLNLLCAYPCPFSVLVLPVRLTHLFVRRRGKARGRHLGGTCTEKGHGQRETGAEEGQTQRT